MFIALAKIPEREGSILPSSLYGSGVNQENQEGRRVQDFLLLPHESWELPQKPTVNEVAYFNACGAFVYDLASGGLFLLCWWLMLLWVIDLRTFVHFQRI